jgi:hypothetical protein
MKWLKEKIGFRKKPDKTDLQKQFLHETWRIFSTDEGQEYLWLLKQRIGYDANPYVMADGIIRAQETKPDGTVINRGDLVGRIRSLSDQHEGKKDLVRLIEESLQQYDKILTKKESENGTS